MISKLAAAFIASAFAMAASAKTQLDDPLPRLKAARTPRDLRAALLDLGVPAKVLDSLQADTGIFASSKLKRAESFQANLDGDAEKETVTQILFEGAASGTADERPRLYLVLVHDGKARGAPAAFRTFDLPYCGYADQGGMTFAFKGGARKDIVFTQKVIESCGMQVAGRDQIDTLRFQSGAYRYLEGPKADESSMDRTDLPEDP